MKKQLDDFTKLKLGKLTEDERKEALQLLLGVGEEVRLKEKIKEKLEIEIETMASHLEAGRELSKSWGRMNGLSTGYKSLDRLTSGLAAGELTILAGKTSYGKTTVAVNITNRVAASGTPVLFVSMEMTKAEIASRFININGDNTARTEYVSNLVAFQKQDELNWQSIDKLVENFCAEFKNGLIVIDHLHYFTRELNNVAEDLGRITKEFKKNAIRHQVPIILISHVRKTTANATMDDLRGSSYIAQDADIVLMVGRPQGQPLVKVKIEKNRNRGFDYMNDEATLNLDGIKITEIGENPFN